MRRLLFLCLCLFVLQHRLPAQESIDLSLEQAVSTALAENKSIKAEQLNREIDRYQKGELYAALYPNVNASAGINHFLDLPQQFLPADFLNPQAPPGEVVGATFGVPNAATAGISARWNVYNQAFFTSLQTLKTKGELTDLGIDRQKESIAYSVTQLYYGISFAEEQLSILEENIEATAELLRIVESNFRNGLITRNEVDKVRVNKANLQSQANSLTTGTEAQLNLLKLLTGIPLTSELNLIENFGDIALQPDAAADVRPAATNDYRMLQKRIELTKTERNTLKTNYLPTLSLNYNYQYNWQSEKLGDLLTTDLKFPQQSVGVQLNVPIFDGRRTRFKLSQNEVQTRQMNVQAEYLSQKISTDITNARLKYNDNINALDARRRNVELAEKVYEQSTFQYKEGLIALNEVINSETALRNAQTQYLNAVSAALSARLDFRKATGTVLNN